MRRATMLAALLCAGVSSASAAVSDSLIDLLSEGLQTPREAVTLATNLDVQALAGCESPDIRLLGTPPPRGGRMAVSLGCKGDPATYTVQVVEVVVEGSYLVAARNIEAGQVVTHDDLALEKAPLNKLPRNILDNIDSVEGKLAVRRMAKGAIIQSGVLRNNPIVTRNSEVKVSVGGVGFHIEGQGQALENAGMNDPVRVKMANGETIRGLVTGPNTVEIEQ